MLLNHGIENIKADIIYIEMIDVHTITYEQLDVPINIAKLFAFEHLKTLW